MGSFFRKYFINVVCCLFVGCILLAGITGCKNDRNTQDPQETKALSTPTETISAQPTLMETVSQQTTSGSDIQENEDKSEMDIKNFKPLQESFIKYDFKVKKNGSESRPNSFFVEGEYDLNQDGKPDKINIMIKGFGDTDGEEVQAYIEVNGIKQDFYMSYSTDGEVRIFDLDKNDKFFEVAIFDEGPSGDPHYDFFRYDGERLYTIGGIDSRSLCNGEGKLLPWLAISRFEPIFYSAWLEIDNDALVEKSNDITGYLGKKYKFSGGDAYFMPCDEIPKDFEPMWSEPKEIQACELEIIDIFFYPDSRVLNYYFVELSNGERGMLYFWIGD